MTTKYSISIMIIIILIGLLFSCNNSVSYKDGGNVDPKIAKEIMILVNVDKGDTLMYHIQDSTFNSQDSIRRKGKDTFPKEQSPVYDWKYRTNKHFKQNGGIVKDAKSAANIAYIYLKNIYGEKEINNELPLNVCSIDNYWFIDGTFNKGIFGGYANGGVAEILISKTDGRVVHVTHGK